MIYIKSNRVPTLPNSSHGLCQVYSKVQTLMGCQKHVKVLCEIECKVLWVVKIKSKGCIKYDIKFNDLFKISQRHTLTITIIHVNFSNQIRGHIRYNIWFNIGWGGEGVGVKRWWGSQKFGLKVDMALMWGRAWIFKNLPFFLLLTRTWHEKWK